MTWRRDASRPRDPQAESARRHRLEEAVHRLAHAAAARDRPGIAELLSPEVETIVDSGGTMALHSHRARGPQDSADSVLQILSDHRAARVAVQQVNGGYGILLSDDGGLVGVLIAEMTHDAISQMWVVLNPDKLGGFDIA